MKYHHVGLDNHFMEVAYYAAKMLYRQHGFNAMPLPVAVLVVDDSIWRVVASANGQHQAQGNCPRLAYNVPSGTRYDLCEACHTSQHAEALAVKDLFFDSQQDARIYVYGHYYFCDSCKEKLKAAGVCVWYIVDDAEMLFDKDSLDCVIGKPEQFQY